MKNLVADPNFAKQFNSSRIMKKIRSLLAVSLCAWAGLTTAHAQLVIPSDGSDGVLDITASTVIDLSQATTAKWNVDNSAHAGQGVYDPDKWAVVFKYRSVKIAAGATVTFANHPSCAPVVWLVAGDVQVAGQINLNGSPGTSGPGTSLSEPGPGGFRGAAFLDSNTRGTGFGPGGACCYQDSTGRYASVYGNPQIVPLIGGSGSASENQVGYGPGASGAGAILIASSRILTLSGQITANGGSGPVTGGSGGGIRIVAAGIEGGGAIDCRPDGRIRLEAPSLSPTITMSPETIAVVPNSPPTIWPPDNSPKVRVLRADGVDSPADPTAPLSRTADIALQNGSASEIILETISFK